LVIGITAKSSVSNSTAYIDGIWTPPEGEMLMLTDLTAEKSSEIVNQFAADQNWWSGLDAQLESIQQQPISPENFEAPEITVDTTVEPTPEPDPVIPDPVVEPTEDETVSEEGGE
tara:strand:- start:141 stop:485 length:345 start_codon:yes stop_codon:yes gene_type:complete